jgi:hypothetical protein
MTPSNGREPLTHAYPVRRVSEETGNRSYLSSGLSQGNDAGQGRLVRITWLRAASAGGCLGLREDVRAAEQVDPAELLGRGQPAVSAACIEAPDRQAEQACSLLGADQIICHVQQNYTEAHSCNYPGGLRRVAYEKYLHRCERIAHMSTSPAGAPTISVGDGMGLLMRQSGFNATDMARKLEVSRMTVGHWLNDRHPPSTPVLMAWAMVTGGSWEWLCAIRDSNPEPADLVTRWAA